MFKRQDMTRPQLQELGPPRMEGQFVALGPLSNFIKILFFRQEISTGGWIRNLNGSPWSTISLSFIFFSSFYLPHFAHKVETPYHDNDLILTPIISPQNG
jgi:hypothetical protein